ncbi:aspartyl-phosphate phosphatase Spo0E family protein [Halobacillus rhizosphaerae]
MIDKILLEQKIEDIRQKMYEVYNHANDYEEVIRISQKLDNLLNKLDEQS